MQILLQTLKSPKALLKKVNNIINYKRSEKLQYTGVLKWNQNYLSWGFIFCNQTCLYKCINDSINICLYMMTGEGIGLITSMNSISKSSGINSDHKRREEPQGVLVRSEVLDPKCLYTQECNHDKRDCKCVKNTWKGDDNSIFDVSVVFGKGPEADIPPAAEEGGYQPLCPGQSAPLPWLHWVAPSEDLS